MSSTIATLPGAHRETVRGFWHGAPIGPYQLLCLRSFTDHGHHVEVFTYDDELVLPDWITRRDANAIVPTDRILRYQSGFGRGSPALHANLFRYALLQRFGGWWVDLDILLLTPDLPAGDFFFARAANGYLTLNNSVMKLPAGHPLLADGLRSCQETSENAGVWGQTGPILLTELVGRHGLDDHARAWQTAYPVPWTDVLDLFDPERCDDVALKCRDAAFLHLFNEIWRGSGIPRQLGPPAGSFLSRCFREHDFGHRFADLMDFEDVARWIGNRRDRIALEESRAALEKEKSALEAARGNVEQAYLEQQRRVHALELRIQQLES